MSKRCNARSTVVEHDLDLKDESATFIMRMRPYRTLANVISGVVITFNNITERKQQKDHLQILMKELQHRTNNLFAIHSGDGAPDRAAQ